MIRFGSSLVLTDDLKTLESILNQNFITKSQLDSGLHTATSIGMKLKVDFQLETKFGNLASLHSYFTLGKGRVVDLLIKSGADVNARPTDVLSSADTTGNFNVKFQTASGSKLRSVKIKLNDKFENSRIASVTSSRNLFI